MRVGRMMFIFALLGVCVAGASCGFFLEIPSLFVSDAPTPLPTPPRELELTDLQREELSRVLSPAPLPAGPKSVGRISIDFADSADDGLYLSGGAEALLPVKLLLRFSAVGTQGPLAVKASYRAYDFYGRAIASGPLPPLVVPAGGVAETTLAFEKIREVGAFTVRVTAEAGGEEVSAVHRFGIIPAPAKVEAEECPFGVAGSSKRFAQYARLGARHVLAHFADGRNVVNFGEQTPDPDQWSPGFNFTPGMETLQRAEDAGVELLPIIGFGPASRKSETAKEASVKRFGTIQGTPYGPPADAAAFADWTAGTVEYFSDRLVRWQIWRDPAVGGWSWAGTPREYRNLLAAVAWELSDREVETGLAFAATAGMLAEAVEAQWEPPAQMACALSTYAESTATSLAAGEFRSELAGALASASRLGATGLYIAETGESPYHGTSQQQAWKLVIRHAEALRLGVQRIYVQDNMGVRNPKSASVAYSVLAHRLAGMKFATEAKSETLIDIEGPIFSGTEGSVAILWSYATDEKGDIRRRALVLDRAGSLEAADVLGAPVGIWDGRRLVVPVGEAPIYIYARGMKAKKLAKALGRARVVPLEPATDEKGKR